MGDPRVGAALASYDTPWAITDKAEAPLRRGRGVSQGDSLSDVTFLAVFVPVLNEIRDELHEDGLLLRYAYKDTIIGGIPQGADTRPIILLDVSYMDDVHFVITSEEADKLMPKLTNAINLIDQKMRQRGFTLNFSKGKTEVMVKFQGKNAMKEAQKIKNEGQCISFGTEGKKLRVVDSYRHMGVIASLHREQARMVADACNKLNEGHTIYRTLMRKKALKQKNKIKIAQVCFSKALYAAHIWTITDPAQLTKLRSRYHAVLREIDGMKANPKKGFFDTDAEVRRTGNHISLFNLLRLRRLNYYRRILVGSDTMKALVQAEGKWASTIADDLEWVYTWSEKIHSLGHPTTATMQWEKFIAENGKRWKTLLKQLQEELRNGTIYDLEPDSHKVPGEGGVFGCGQCSMVFTTIQGLNLHCKKAHDRRSLARGYAAGDGGCWCCLQVFGNRPRLILHLTAGLKAKGAGSCLGQLSMAEERGARAKMDPEAAAQLEKADAELAKANVRKGLHPAYGEKREMGLGSKAQMFYGPLRREYMVA
eukprot:TRINITY_DN67204_c0_g2_i1.p1 TRINITY_DN67204_c0_g2~~TRINITY_DN67204_c0_g2_i1.p1  ORF type:complete len:555 (+),score=90.87 TRINITY_DN67204_c0_g2_i1:56-1666(+)